MSTRCFIAGLAFDRKDDKILFSNAFGTGDRINNGALCASEQPAFDFLKNSLLGVTNFRMSDSNLVLESADDKDVLTLEPIEPKGFEFRHLTITLFRYAGKLRRVKRLSGEPADIVFYDGRIDGSTGCGGLMASSYEKLDTSKYKFFVWSILAGMCNNIDRSLKQVDRISRAFNGIRSVEAKGNEFVLRDDRGDIQIILSDNSKRDAP